MAWGTSTKKRIKLQTRKIFKYNFWTNNAVNTYSRLRKSPRVNIRFISSSFTVYVLPNDLFSVLEREKLNKNKSAHYFYAVRSWSELRLSELAPVRVLNCVFYTVVIRTFPASPSTWKRALKCFKCILHITDFACATYVPPIRSLEIHNKLPFQSCLTPSPLLTPLPSFILA